MHAFWEIVASNTLMALLLAVCVAFVSRVWKNPVAIHLLWVLVLLKLVTPPLITLPLRLPSVALLANSTEDETTQELAHPSPVEASRTSSASLQDPRRPEKPTAGGNAERSVVQSIPVAEGSVTPRVALLGFIWGMGIVIVGSVHAVRIVRFARLLRAGQAAPPPVHRIAQDVSRRLGLKKVPTILLLPVRLSPLVWWLGGRPRVVLPTELFERLDAYAREMILAHELAHVRRRDHWIRVLELIVATLFWWHPVVWWACRQLRELEEECCDGLVVSMSPCGAKTYTLALLDTLDFLSERPTIAPLGAMAARSSVSLTRRIKMLSNGALVVRLTAGRLVLLAAVAVFPMALAFAAEPQKPADPSPETNKEAARPPDVQRRAVNKRVKDFPEKTDLSTPESAQAAWCRISGSMDAKALLELGWWKYGPREIEEIEQQWKRDPKDTAIYKQAQRDSEILEVLGYREDLASVTSKLKFPEGYGRHPYSARCFGRINGVWKNLGEDRLGTLEEARENFERKRDNLWRVFSVVREAVKEGRSITPVEAAEKLGPIASNPRNPSSAARAKPSEERLVMMGRVEDFFLHNFRDITARKSLEWGDLQKTDSGNRSIRYMYEARIWDRETKIMNQVFTFDPQGGFVKWENVEGFPKDKAVKPVDVKTQAGMKDLVEDFFTKNFRDITSRETIEWGDVTKADGGNSSIRYKYRARIWDRETKIMNQVFTFDPQGNFVSVKHVEGFPQNP